MTASDRGGPEVSFPRRHARTRGFTLGVPRDPTVAPDGRVLFLRSPAGDDPATQLWLLDPGDGATAPREELVVDPRALGDAADVPAEERARRERLREQAGGVTAYTTDRDVTIAAFTLAGRLHTVDLATGTVVAHPSAGPVFDPAIAPDGRSVAYVSGDALHLLALVAGPTGPGATRPLVVETGVAWGRAEFVAAEEMGRLHGCWWSPDGRRLAVTRVDESEVPLWHVADPASPWDPPAEQRYPAAGTVNADVRLAVLDVDNGRRVDVGWDRDLFPYLTRVLWGDDPLTIQIQSRDQRTVRVVVVDPDTGAGAVRREITDPAWVELVDGSPAWAGTRLVTVEDRHDHGPGGSRTLVVDGAVVADPGVQVRRVVAADEHQVVFTASVDDPTQIGVWRWTDAGGATCLTAAPGVHGAVAGRTATVLTTAALGGGGPTVEVVWSEPSPSRHRIEVRAEPAPATPRPRRLVLGPRELHGALLLPQDDPADGPLPVVLDPYGGPHAQRVLTTDAAFRTSQWLADQGFAVLVVDGRGSPARGPAWERAIAGDLAGPALEDQVDALLAAAAVEPRLDLGRVGIRGWSFGGFLAALALLRRPDVFRAAVAGAPVTDWRLYDTHYTERYLGRPDEDPAAYLRSSLIDGEGELVDAVPWDGAAPELLLVHGLADDNVVAAHTLRLSSALLAAGRPHRFLPLSGVTHMTPQEVVAERLLLLQVDFLRGALRRDR